jgi:hypothetical protein
VSAVEAASEADQEDDRSTVGQQGEQFPDRAAAEVGIHEAITVLLLLAKLDFSLARKELRPPRTSLA